ncbi:MAG TPA: copper oxidase [Humisphaera sp.]|jgi:FtsP/CotA-like multicopper oxidase with cupredoxin domain|nr:copper oxidase [Humisphaera sp.]
MSRIPITRRQIIGRSAATLAAAPILLSPVAALAAENVAAPQENPRSAPSAPGEADKDYTPVTTPNGATLPFKIVDGVKVFHLIAEQVEHEFASGLKARCWGYNGRTPGPTIEAVEGDRVRIYVTNRLPAPTTVHWHGLRIPNGMDGVNGLTQKPIEPGQTFRYEFTLTEHGTYMYHPHFDEMTQQGLGMMGMFIIHPRDPQVRAAAHVDRDFVLMLSEWRLDPGAMRPNPIEMTDFNILTINSKAYPATEPLVVRKGQRVRIRFGNLSAMEHHPIHLHGYQFRVAESDGGRIPQTAQSLANTIFVPVGSTRAIEFVADAEGDWPMHCHMTHHTMNQMGHNLPNMVGVDPKGLDQKFDRVLPQYMTMGETGMGDMGGMQMAIPKNSIAMRFPQGPFGIIDMGGMFTILKVRDGIANYADPGWYKHPAGTVADKASEEEMKRDGIAIHET